MRINELKIDGFGIWRGLHLPGLSGGLNVFYGPNEAGKTTLLDFVRGVLYGYSPERRRRYLPPRRGGDGGGTLWLSSAEGNYCILRRDAGAGDIGPLHISDSAGRTLSPGALGHLLRHLDEQVFNHVFALGLEELQELGTLSDDEVAARLYQLSTGLRGITLAQVLSELETSRQRILAENDQPGQLKQLLDQRESVRAELQELRKLTSRYGELAQERERLECDVAELESSRDRLAQESRIVETAIRVRPLWRRRGQLETELATRPNYLAVGPEEVARFDTLKRQLRRRKKELKATEPAVRRVRAELETIPVNDALYRQGARIETLCDQQDWIAGLEIQLAEAQQDVTDLQGEQSRLRKQLGWPGSDGPTDVLAHDLSLSALRPVARAQQQARRALEEAQADAQRHQQAAAGAAEQIAAALGLRSDVDLSQALSDAGQRVNQLRRRIQLDEQISQLEHSREELEEENRELYGRQMLPTRTLAILASVFAVGVALLLAGMLLPSAWVGGHGLGMALLGLFSSAGAVVAKLLLERHNERSLDNCGKQLAMVKQQIEQAADERDQLDKQLPRGGGPLVTRLQSAEKELAALEDLLPHESRRQTSQREAETAQMAALEAEEQLNAARRRWQELLAEHGLPASIRPKQLASWAEDAQKFNDATRRLAARRREVGQRREALDALAARLTAVFDDAQLVPVGQGVAGKLRQLRQALADNAQLVEQRDQLKAQLRRLRRRAVKLARLLDEYKLRRRTLLMAAGVDDEETFRARAAEQLHTLTLQEEFAQVRSEVAAALADQLPESSIRPWLEEPAIDQLDEHWEQVATQLHEVELAIRQKFELRGQLNEQLKSLAADRRPAEKRLEFDMLNERLAQAIHRWQVLALTHRLLDRIREIYQRERQPLTLQAASGYFAAMTSGRYVRVWTPLSEDVLLVDDAEGETLSIDVLSRGTREQLFLSLRLALAADYADRGVSFPLIFDDLLVNFDMQRARATAQVLKDFAAGGRQVLIFTCHEHIKRLFQDLDVRVRRLPDNAQHDGTAEFEVYEAPRLPDPLPLRTLPAAEAAPAAAAAPVAAGEADAFRGWPADDDQEGDLVTIDDHSSFWTLVAHTRPWDADGAEEFAGEFAERVVEEIRQQRGPDYPVAMGGTRPRAARRRQPAGSQASQNSTPSGHSAPSGHAGSTETRGRRAAGSEARSQADDSDSEAA